MLTPFITHLSYTSIITRHIIFIALAIATITHGAAQNHAKVDSLIKSLPAIIDHKEEVKNLIDIGEFYAESVKMDSSLYYLNKGVDIADRHDLDTLLARVYYGIGYTYDLGGDLGAALQYYELAREQYSLLNIPTEIISCMNSKGVAAYFQGDYELALKHYLDALNFADSTGVRSKQGDLLNNIGVIYRITLQTDQALAIYRRSLRFYQDDGNVQLVGYTYQNMGVAYTYKENLDSSIFYLDRAYDILQSTGQEDELPSLYNAYADAYYICGPDYKKAKAYTTKAEQLGLKYNNQEVLSKIYLLCSQIDGDDNRIRQAIEALNKGFDIVELTDREDLKLDYYEQAAAVYDQADEKATSLDYMKKYVALYKVVQATEKVNAIADSQKKYESIEKEKEIERLRYEEEITQLRVSRQRWLLVIAGVSLLVMGYLFYKMFRQKEEIVEKNSAISKALGEKEILLKEIHHRVKNNLHFISALLGLQTDHVADQVALSALQEGQDRVQSMALIHQDLYQRDDLTSVNVKDYFIKLTEGLFDSYNIHTDDISLQLDIAELDLDVDTVVPIGLMVNELVSNCLKYAFSPGEKGVVQVFLREVDQTLLLRVSDNGRGVTPDIIDSFGESLGYKLIHALSAQLDGSYHIDGEHGGTIVTIKINKYRKSEPGMPIK